jgi:hypothetical protein
MRSEVDKAAMALAASVEPAAEVELPQSGAAALERGSQEAFSSFFANLTAQKTTEDKLVETGKKSVEALTKIERHVRGGVVLTAAPGL